jgi:hypothetical protein
VEPPEQPPSPEALDALMELADLGFLDAGELRAALDRLREAGPESAAGDGEQG